ncbi:hypothetical protein SLEP1_g48886 [Rubroshorea leprosula]|nr:hypothetical protein SLEP1_g48886 [Rubroshorea leprosula]
MQNDAGNHAVDLSQLTSSEDSIFRIPGLFKMHNEQAYAPYKFSIGPWHFGKTQELRTGQNMKESYLVRFINRFEDPEAKKDELEEAIKREREKARICYEGGDVYGGKNLDVAIEEFEEILLLDGCFIIELLCTRDAPQVFSWVNYQVILHDLLLLDNQIPWFVLELLFDEIHDQPQFTDLTLVKLARDFFASAIPPCEFQQLQTSNILHVVDFVWRFWSDSQKMRLGSYNERFTKKSIPSATRLKEAGVKFEVIIEERLRHTLDVRFNKGVLEIPCLLIGPWTETILRNLIIFEQCSIGCTPCVTWYAVLLDCLVDTADDVDLLSRAGVLENRLNPEETAKFLNRLRDNTLINGFRYDKLCEDVNNYCKRGWPRWRASLIQNYFTKPWAIVSVVFATIVLFFTIMQVFYK